MARILDSVFGHKEVIAKLLASLTGERPGQTFLFVGPSGIGKKKVAWGLAQALLCEKSPTACGQCGSCHRVEALAHESLKMVQPNGVSIKIEDSREIIEFLNLQSLTGHRVIIIDQAQTLNPQAANALLKILEEPPSGTFFFLIAPSVAGLMPTIRSRSRVVSFKPLTPAEISRGSGLAPEWAVRASLGSFEKLAQLQDGPEQELRSEALGLLDQFLNDKDFLTPENNWRDVLKERAKAQRVFGYWVSFLRDVLYYKEDHKKFVMNIDQSEFLKTLAERDNDQILSLWETALRLESEVQQNRDPQLLVEGFWIEQKERNL